MSLVLKQRNGKLICTNLGEWPKCTACDGRMHLPECTSRRNKRKDCCDARHIMLYNQGHSHGLIDSSVSMLAGINKRKYQHEVVEL